MTSSLERYSGFLERTPAGQSYESFIKSIVFVPGTLHGHGTTWLELYILYRMSGSVKPVPDDINLAKVKAPIGVQLKRFKIEMRRAIQRILINSSDSKLFSPAPQHVQPLIGLGIEGYLAMVRFRVALTCPASETLKSHAVQLAHGISYTKAKEFVSGRTKLKPKSLRLRGRVRWDSQIRVMNHIFDSDGVSMQTLHEATEPEPSAELCFFRCPRRCGGVDVGGHEDFQLRDLDKKHTCSLCKKRTEVKWWMCECGRAWHLCRTHQHKPEGIRCMRGAEPRAKAANGRQQKRRAAPNPEEPKRKRSGSDVITLTGRVWNCNHLLSTRLKERLGL